VARLSRYHLITIAEEGEIVRLKAEEQLSSRQTAQRIGCDQVTVLNILKDPVNRQRVQARRLELFEAAKTRYLRDLKARRKRGSGDDSSHLDTLIRRAEAEHDPDSSTAKWIMQYDVNFVADPDSSLGPTA